MKQTLLSVNLKGLRGVRAVMLLAFLSLFSTINVFAQTASLPYTNRSNWGQASYPLPSGWSRSNAQTFSGEIGGTSTLPLVSAKLALGGSGISNSDGDYISIAFDQRPGAISFNARVRATSGTTSPGFTGGILVVEQSTLADGSSGYNTLPKQQTTSLATTAAGTLITFTPHANARSIRIRYAQQGSEALASVGIDNVAITGTPEISVEAGGVAFTSGSAIPFDFGSQDVGTTTPATFTIKNTGSTLSITGNVTILGTDANQFEVTSQPTASIVTGGSTTFTVSFKPTNATPALKIDATLSIPNNDSDENPYLIKLSGTAVEVLTITSFSPAVGPVGTEVTVIGSGFTENFALAFSDGEGGYVFADVINFDNSSQIRAVVPQGAGTGIITVVDDAGLAESSDVFTVFGISSFSPGAGKVGDEVIITGSGFTENFALAFSDGNGGYVFADIIGFDSPTQIRAVVPEGSGTGIITIVDDAGLAESQDVFTVESTPLPVELVNFTATPTTVGAKLSWQTASEKDNAYFEVQSTNNLKSGEFKTLGRVITQNGNSNTLLSYEFLDATAARGTTVYYRLKQVDTDGAFEYSKVVSVNIKQAAKGKGLVNVYPNPFKEQVNLEVEVEQAGEMVATLYDARGYKVFAKSISVEVGVSNILVNLPTNLKTGLYFLTTQVDGTTKTTRLIKE